MSCLLVTPHKEKKRRGEEEKDKGKNNISSPSSLLNKWK